MIQGIRLEFGGALPVQTSIPGPIKCSDKDSEVIYLEMASFPKRGFFQSATMLTRRSYLTPFSGLRDHGGKRIILIVSWLNTFLKFEHFKCGTINFYSTTELISNGAYMASIGLSDAYFSCLIHPSDRKYLRFLWRNQLIEFCRLA